ncbi:MAG: Sec-independent protein translocase subunit TatA [Methylobacter sp.]
MGFSVTQLLIVLAIIVVLFGTKRLRNVGVDLGGAINGFRSAIKEGESTPVDEKSELPKSDVMLKNDNV